MQNCTNDEKHEERSYRMMTMNVFVIRPVNDLCEGSVRTRFFSHTCVLVTPKWYVLSLLDKLFNM